MSEVKRFYAPGLDCMWRDKTGAPRELIEMVLATDYAALEAERDALREQLADAIASAQLWGRNTALVCQQRDKLAGLLNGLKGDLRAAMNWGDLERIAERINAALAEVE